jgi:hypothetical protein
MTIEAISLRVIDALNAGADSPQAPKTLSRKRPGIHHGIH